MPTRLRQDWLDGVSASASVISDDHRVSLKELLKETQRGLTNSQVSPRVTFPETCLGQTASLKGFLGVAVCICPPSSCFRDSFPEVGLMMFEVRAFRR